MLRINMKRVIFLMVIISIVVASCKDEQLVSPNFDVTATVTKTQTPNEAGTEMLVAYQVRFVFSGNAKNIVFYSGENGSEYRNHNRYHTGYVTPHVRFSSAYSSGNIPNTLRVMVSNDFKPEYEYLSGTANLTLYTKAGVEAATWTDITNRFRLPGNQLTPGVQEGGEAVISEFHQSLPLFIAFRFDADKSSDESLMPGEWTFSQFSIRNEYDDGSSSWYINNVLDNYWRTVDLADPTTRNVNVSANSINLNGNQYSVTRIEEGNEVVDYFPTTTVKTMLISRPFYPSLVDTDKGMIVKAMGERVPEFSYLYVNPQKESVTVNFVVTNSLYGEDIQEVKQMEIFFPVEEIEE